MFSDNACEAKMGVISFNLCDGRRIQHGVPVYICNRWCLTAAVLTVGMPFHVLLDSSFLLRLPMSPGKIFRWLFLLQKQDLEMHPHWPVTTAQPHVCYVMQAKTQCGISHCLFSSAHQHKETSHRCPFIAFPTCLSVGFFLSHSYSAGAFNSQTCSQIFSDVSCGAKKGFFEFDWSGCHKPGWVPFVGH